MNLNRNEVKHKGNQRFGGRAKKADDEGEDEEEKEEEEEEKKKKATATTTTTTTKEKGFLLRATYAGVRRFPALGRVLAEFVIRVDEQVFTF